MRLKNKTLTGLVQSLSYVDKMLRQQGFQRSGGVGMPTYDVVIYDSASSSSYFLRIPTSLSNESTGKGELTVKLGHPYLEAKFCLGTPSDELFFIPKAVREAAEHKLAEVADYLSSSSGGAT
ncbi:hypothetical protein ACAF76_006115 [Brevibacillus sp. TJ4]|uniref:hypothetical protein n=1 Tax=Brevibacillus sp. TJ4 TaxID=3234853 RepID=UPI0037D1BDAE